MYFYQFAEQFKEAKGSTRSAAVSTASSASSSSGTAGSNVAVSSNGTSNVAAVNGTTISPLGTPSIGHKSSSVKSNSSASSGEVRIMPFFQSNTVSVDSPLSKTLLQQ